MGLERRQRQSGTGLEASKKRWMRSASRHVQIMIFWFGLAKVVIGKIGGVGGGAVWDSVISIVTHRVYRVCLRRRIMEPAGVNGEQHGGGNNKTGWRHFVKHSHK
jgi:hypothetical protein